MLILSNKLMVLMAASTAKTTTFTAMDLVDQTIATFPSWADQDLIDEKSLRSTVSGMQRTGLIMVIGEQERVQEPGKWVRPRNILCFTDVGRKQRIDAAERIGRVMVELTRIVEADLLSLRTPMKKPRARRPLPAHPNLH